MVLFDRFTMEGIIHINTTYSSKRKEQFGWRTRNLCPSAATVIDTQDLHFLRNAREKAFNEGTNRSKYRNNL